MTYRGPRCQWAACDRAAYVFEDGWHHCRSHILEHREETGRGKAAVVLSRDDVIRRMNAEGCTDKEIAEHLGFSDKHVNRLRRRLGLPARGKRGHIDVKPCGTAAAARRHRRNKEPLCEPCRKAANAYNRIEGYPSSQKRWAS